MTRAEGFRLGLWVYIAGWAAWVAFITLLSLYGVSDAVWAHIVASSVILAVYILAFLTPIPAPLGMGLIPIPIPDVFVTALPVTAVTLFPVFFLIFQLTGTWRTWWCTIWWGGAVVLYLLRVVCGRVAENEIRRTFRDAGLDEALAKQEKLGGSKVRPFGTSVPFFGTKYLVVRCRSMITPVTAGELEGCCGAGRLDIWKAPAYSKCDKLPVILFIHGGAWRGGSHRYNATVSLLHRLALRGWLVVSCSYTKTRKWPIHAEGCAKALTWLHENAERYGGDKDSIVLMGSSAGGHIAAILAAILTANGPIPKEVDPIKKHLPPSGIPIRGFVGVYPALDPKDESHSCIRWPKCLGGESLMEWFFRFAVGIMEVEGDGEEPPSVAKWRGVQPRGLLRKEPSSDSPRFTSPLTPDSVAPGVFPRTLLVHGACDSVVPVAHSRRFLADLRMCPRPRGAPQDMLVEVPFHRHTMDLSPTNAVDVLWDGVAAWLECLREAPRDAGQASYVVPASPYGTSL